MVRKAQGSPFFAEQLIQGLLSEQYLTRIKPHRECVVRPNVKIDECPIPDAVQVCGQLWLGVVLCVMCVSMHALRYRL